MTETLTHNALLWKAVNLRRESWERKFNLYFRKVLNNELQKLTNSITSTNCYDLDLPDKVMEKEPIEKALITLYYNVGTSFAKAQSDKLKSDRGSIFVKEPDAEDWYKVFSAYVKTRAGDKIVSIAKENRKQAKTIIRRVIEGSVEAGMGADEMARAMRKALEVEGTLLNQWRALRIARTEVMSASNLGAMEGARATGYPLKKFWIATYDSRTRDTHLVVEQQNPKAFDEAFQVGNYKMQQPGDEAGGPEEVINCRCAIAFEMI